MKRNNTAPAPDAILTADIHLTTRTPVARTDDVALAQHRKVAHLRALQERYGCSILDGGDLFDYWKAPPWLSAYAYHNLPAMVTVPGNHDLPEHSLAKYEHSALHLLGATRDDIAVSFTPPPIVDGVPQPTYRGPFAMYSYPNGTFDYRIFEGVGKDPERTNVLVLHEFVWPGLKPPFKEAPGYMAQALLRKLHTHFDLILCGDNHKGFVESYEGCVLVNPGSMLRLTADFIGYRPRCYLYYSDSNAVVPEYYPIEEAVLSTAHLDRVKARDERIAAYIKHMNVQWEQGLSFRANLESYFQANDTPKSVKELIWLYLETTSA